MSSDAALPGLDSLDTISKFLLTVSVIIQVGSYVEPFLFLFDGEATWYLWLSLNIVTCSFAIAGVSIRSGCRSPQGQRPLTSAWTPTSVTFLFWVSIVLCGFGLLLLVAFVLYYSIAPSLPRALDDDFWDRFGYVILLCFQLAPPLTVYGLGAGFFYRRAQELRAQNNAASGYSGVELNEFN